jgi:hypothetical protein
MSNTWHIWFRFDDSVGKHIFSLLRHTILNWSWRLWDFQVTNFMFIWYRRWRVILLQFRAPLLRRVSLYWLHYFSEWASWLVNWCIYRCISAGCLHTLEKSIIGKATNLNILRISPKDLGLNVWVVFTNTRYLLWPLLHYIKCCRHLTSWYEIMGEILSSMSLFAHIQLHFINWSRIKLMQLLVMSKIVSWYFIIWHKTWGCFV